MDWQGEGWGILHLEDDVQNLVAALSWERGKSERGYVMEKGGLVRVQSSSKTAKLGFGHMRRSGVGI